MGLQLQLLLQETVRTVASFAATATTMVGGPPMGGRKSAWPVVAPPTLSCVQQQLS